MANEDRVTQLVVEAAEQDTGEARVTQAVVEIGWKDPTEARVTQLVVEIIIRPGPVLVEGCPLPQPIPIPSAVTGSYWASTYWADSYWAPDYWPSEGAGAEQPSRGCPLPPPSPV